MNERIFKEIFSKILTALDEFRSNRDISEIRDLFLTLFIFRFLSSSHHSFAIPERAKIGYLLANGESGLYQRLNSALTEIEQKNPRLSGIFGTPYNPNDSQNNFSEKQLYNLLEDLNRLPFEEDWETYSEVHQEIYSRLIAHFAERSIKTAPDFYSPIAIAKLIAALLNPQPGMSIYDPVCGSGGFLLAAAQHVKAIDRGQSLGALAGQDVNLSTWRIAKQNMLIHGFGEADIKLGNVLTDPQHIDAAGWLATFDIVIANPPFSLRQRTKVEPHEDRFNRFIYGPPPLQNADYAFIQHILASLNPLSRAAVIVSDGVLFRGASEQKIRQAIIQSQSVEAVISLPPNLFYGTAIPANILILRKRAAGDAIFFIDARAQTFAKEKRLKTIEKYDFRKITDAFRKRESIPGVSRIVSLEEVSDNDFNLTVSRYIAAICSEEEASITELIHKQAELETTLQQLQAEIRELTNSL
jgi:type I restriction enzyme M protein